MTDLATITRNLKPSQTLTTEQRLEVLMDIRERIEDGYVSIRQLAAIYGVDKNTAAHWRKAALTLIKNDDQGLDRATIKRMQVGRLQVQIESLQDDLKKTDDIKERMMVHQRINAYYDTLHRITGLNTETLQIEHQLKPLQINMPTVIDATPIDQMAGNDNKALAKPQAD